MADETPYERIQRAIRNYGEAAMENFVRCRALGYALAEGLDDYLQAPEPCVALVPPEGPFDPKRHYGDAAFSYDPSQPIRLEPIAFGLCVVVPNAEDSGNLWIRTALKVEVAEERFEIFVAHQPRVRIPLAFEGKLAPLYQTLLAEFLQLFREELADFGDPRYQNRIGFVPNLPGDGA